MPDINWGLLGQQPNFVGDYAQSFDAGRQMGMMKQSDQAVRAAQANPDDPNALRTLALYNPQAANAFMAVQANQRAASARSAAADAYRSYSTSVAPPQPMASAPMAPQAAPQQPANGQITTLPNVPQMLSTLPGGAQPAPGAGAAPQGQSGTIAPGATSPSAMLQPDHPLTQAVGAAVASGQMTVNDAIAKFSEFADPQETAVLIGNIANMDVSRRTRLKESSDALAAEAQALKNVPAANRKAAALAALPQLAAHGVTPDMINGADLSDQGLDGIIGQSIGAGALFDQAAKMKEQGFDQQRIDIAKDQTKLGYAQLGETTRRDTMEFNKPVGVPFGQSLVNPQSGDVVYDGFGGGGTKSDPYNVVVGNGQYGKPDAPLTSMTLGQVYDFGRSTLIPNTKAAGVGKDSRGVLGSSAVGAYQITGETLARMAPQVLGADWKNQAFTPQVQDRLGQAIYNDAVAKGTPLNKVWASLSPSDAAALKGKPWADVRSKIIAGESGGGGKTSGGMAGLQSQAQMIANYEIAAPAGRQMATPYGIALMQMVQTMNPQYNAAEFPTRQKAYGAFKTGKQGDTVRSLNVAVDHLDQLQAASTALSNGNVQAFNSISNQFRQWGGSSIPTNFAAIKTFVMDEVTKAIVGSGGGVGDREKADSIISSVQSPDQLAGAIYRVKGLMAGQLKGLKLQYEQSTGRTDFMNYLTPITRCTLGFKPPSEAVNYLRQHNDASTRSQFDAKYGNNSASYYTKGR